VHIAPHGTGAFSAILSLIDPTTGLEAYQTLNTVIVPLVLDATDGYRVETEGKAPRPGNTNVFIKVPEGAQALTVRAQLKGCRAALEFTDPDGNSPLRVAGAMPQTETVYTPVTEGEIRRAFDDPRPGVWQIAIENGGDFDVYYDAQASDPLQSCDFKLSAGAFAVKVQTAAGRVKSNQAYTAQTTNRLASFSGKIASLGLGSARLERLTLHTELQPLIYEFEVPRGTTKIEAVISGASDPQANVDLYLFDGSGVGPPFLAAYSVHDGSDKHVEVLDPKPGKWLVVVDPYRLPHGAVQIDYRDTFYHEAFGRIELSSAGAEQDKGSEDRASFRLEVDARPQGERTLVAALGVVSDEAYVNSVDPDAHVPEASPYKMPEPVPTKKVPILIQSLVLGVE